MAGAKRVGYAVMGLGSISQVAVLPAFAHSKKAKLAAVVSGVKKKAHKFANQFKAIQAFSSNMLADRIIYHVLQEFHIRTLPGDTDNYAVAIATAIKYAHYDN